MEKSVKEIVAEIKEKDGQTGWIKACVFCSLRRILRQLFSQGCTFLSEAKLLALLHIPAMNLFMQHQKNWMSGASQLFVH